VFRSAVLSYEAGGDPAGAVALLRALAPGARSLALLVRLPISWHLWPSDERWRELEAPLDASFAGTAHLRDQLVSEGFGVHVDVEPDFTLEPLHEAVTRTGADVVVLGPFAQASAAEIASWAEDLTRSAGVPVVLAPRGDLPPRPAAHLICPFDGEVRSLAAVAAFLRDRSRAEHRVTLLSLGDEIPAAPLDVDALATVAGIRAPVSLARLAASPLDVADRIEAFAEANGDGVVILAAGRTGVLGWLSGRARRRLVERAALPVIVVPALPDAGSEASLDAPDLLVTGRAVTLHVIHVTGLGGRGHPAPLPDQDLAIIADGRIACICPLRAGRIVLDLDALGPGELPSSIGIGPSPPGGATDPLAIIAAHVSLVRPGPGCVLLFDARLDGAALAQIRALIGAEDRLAVGVRLALDDSVGGLRARVAAAGFARPVVLDARGVLDEGEAADVPPNVDAVRLCRVAGRLRAAGVHVDAVVHAPCEGVLAAGFAAVAVADLPSARERIAAAFVAPPAPDAGVAGLALAGRLDVTTGAPAFLGNRVEVTLDNAVARRRLLELVRGARERVHVQVYIVDDDATAREVAGALGEAAARGVVVRVLVDALYSLHGSYGVTNPVLVALDARAGVTVLASRPLRGLPTIEDLKQRDHRKILVVDGAVAVVGGRNLGDVYYRGFDEARLTPLSGWREVPWLDAGARVEGPAATALDASFLAAWVEAGGEPFALSPPVVAGDVRARVVIHRGLRDAYTLEAYLAIIDGARARLDVVNGFPLQFEVQHALLRAVARGVRVRVLIGRARPVFGAGVPFPGSSAIQEVANQLVHARMDALVEAGGEVYELTLSPREGWDPALGAVRAHVHAKLMSADGAVTALGSANLDITAGYWESEALLVLEDPRATAEVEAELDALFAGATRLDPADPAFRDRLVPRAWLSLHWPSLVG
jgi:cardiolipin synthase A/B